MIPDETTIEGEPGTMPAITLPEPPNRFEFGKALAHLRAGRNVSRWGWNGPGQSITLQRPDEQSKMTLPYIYIKTVQGDRVPWLASQTDLLAEDWYLA